MPDLADHIARIANDEQLPQRVEEAARQTAVLPVLDALGWDCWDGNEVTPEFEVRGGRVDYCLQIPGRRLVLIEVKRTGTDLTGHQEQLLRYAFDEGVPLAALTDGRVWWLYLSTAAGNWEQRRFFNIDFSQPSPSEGEVDRRLPSRARVLGLLSGGDALAVPFSALGFSPTANVTVGDTPAAVFWQRGTASALSSTDVAQGRDVGAAVAFDARLEGRTLTFKAERGVFLDERTGSAWSVTGEALSGPLAGSRLNVLPHVNSFWSCWAAFHPETAVYASS